MEDRGFDRTSMIEELRAVSLGRALPFDLIVIGGGITGSGVALDAAARGMRVALVERGDFAGGTSSKSSKLVHGGLRYLQNGEFRLVYEALGERRRLMRNAAHLVEIQPFLIPIMTRDGVIKKRIARALGSAMWMYDLTGGWRIGRLHRRASAEESAAHFPTSHVDQLSAGYVYYDAAADDARLTLTIARTAAQHGAVVVNHCRVVDLSRGHSRLAGSATNGDEVDGVTLDADGERLTVPTRRVVNATGVWADGVRSMEDPSSEPQIRPAKGVHITVPWEKVRNDIAVIIPSRGDRRSVFLMPWGPNPDGTFRHTYVGTTDTDHRNGLDDPHCDAEDIEYLLEALNAAITETVTSEDVTGVWCGLRPLVRATDDVEKTADLSRRHVVEAGPAGVITVNGGKLTTYRSMAQDTVDAVVASLPGAPRRWRRHVTSRLAVIGASDRRNLEPGSLDEHLHRRYGARSAEVMALRALDTEMGERPIEGQPYLNAEVVYAVRQEMAIHLDDVLLRRTRAHLFDRAATLTAAPLVADLMADELGWDDARRAAELSHYQQICEDEQRASESHDDITHATD